MPARLLPLCLCLLSLGCLPPAENIQTSKPIPAVSKEHDHASHEGAHHHYGLGPNGGSVVELGEDEYHAELVFDHDVHAITVYLLGADAKSPVPSMSPDVTLSLDQGKSAVLKASPLDGETDGHSSRYVVVDEELVHSMLSRGFLHGDLTLQIAGKPYRTHLDLHFDNTKHEHKK